MRTLLGILSGEESPKPERVRKSKGILRRTFYYSKGGVEYKIKKSLLGRNYTVEFVDDGEKKKRKFQRRTTDSFLEPVESLDDVTEILRDYLANEAEWVDDKDQLVIEEEKKWHRKRKYIAKRTGQKEGEVEVTVNKKLLGKTLEFKLHGVGFDHTKTVALDGFILDQENGSQPNYEITSKLPHFELFRDFYREKDPDLKRFYEVVPSAKRYISLVFLGSISANTANSLIMSSVLDNIAAAGTIVYLSQLITHRMAKKGENDEIKFAVNRILSNIPETAIGMMTDDLSNKPGWYAWEDIESELFQNVYQGNRYEYSKNLNQKLSRINKILKKDGTEERRLKIYDVLGYDGYMHHHLDETISCLKPRDETIDSLVDNIYDVGLLSRDADVEKIKELAKRITLEGKLPDESPIICERETLEQSLQRLLKDYGRILKPEELEDTLESSFDQYKNCFLRGFSLNAMAYAMWGVSSVWNPGFLFWSLAFGARAGLSGYNLGIATRLSENYFFEVYEQMLKPTKQQLKVVRQKYRNLIANRSRDAIFTGALIGVTPNVIEKIAKSAQGITGDEDVPYFTPACNITNLAVAGLAGLTIVYRYGVQVPKWIKEATRVDLDKYQKLYDKLGIDGR